MTLHWDRLCTWCSHLVHDGPCTRRIQTSGGKKPAEAPCPCHRHLQPGQQPNSQEILTGSPRPANRSEIPTGSPD